MACETNPEQAPAQAETNLESATSFSRAEGRDADSILRKTFGTFASIGYMTIGADVNLVMESPAQRRMQIWGASLVGYAVDGRDDGTLEMTVG